MSGMPSSRVSGFRTHPIGMGLVGMSSVSRANMAVSESRLLARLMSDTCRAAREHSFDEIVRRLPAVTSCKVYRLQRTASLIYHLQMAI